MEIVILALIVGGFLYCVSKWLDSQQDRSPTPGDFDDPNWTPHSSDDE